MGKRSRLIDPNTVVEALLPDTPPERATERFQELTRERSRTYSAAEGIAAATLEELRLQVGKAGLLIHEIHVGDETLSEVEGPLTSRIVEMTGRPAILLRQAGGQINFSGRARGKFSFESFLSDPEFYALTLAMGGHRQAIGGSIRPQDRNAFVDAVRRWEQRQLPAEVSTAPAPPPILLPQLDPATAYLYARAIGPFGNRLRPPRFRTTIVVRGGWAFSGDFLVELARPLGPGTWEVTFRFNEAACDGENVAIRVEGALHE
jgi:single-stranded DNA-specific DHH superfamily exonuclease